MINPYKITNFKRSDKELLEFIIFCIFVAGKNSEIVAKKTNSFFKDFIKHKIKNERVIYSLLKKHKIGQYNRIKKALIDISKLDLRKCSLEDLENCYGVGPKTSRFFLLHSRQNQNFAVLDVHILKWMRKNLKIKTPKNTPQKNKYLSLERKFLNFCLQKNVKPSTLDFQI